MRPAHDDDARPRLTTRQDELLRHCVERGYYDIPRATTLRHLAAELGISMTSLSLTLRRAESKIVAAYAKRPGEPPAAMRQSRAIHRAGEPVSRS